MIAGLWAISFPPATAVDLNRLYITAGPEHPYCAGFIFFSTLTDDF